MALSLHLVECFVTLVCQPLYLCFHTRNNHCYRTHHCMFDDRQLLDDVHSASLIQWSQQQWCWKLVKKCRQENGYNLLHISPWQIILFVVPLHGCSVAICYTHTLHCWQRSTPLQKTLTCTVVLMLIYINFNQLLLMNGLFGSDHPFVGPVSIWQHNLTF